MAGALRSLTPPPIPNPRGVSLGVQQKPGNPSVAAPPPAPTHEQTVAGLRHLAAVYDQLLEAKRDPDLGRTNVRGKVIDGLTTLVSRNMVGPGDAVNELVTFPERPFEQKQWVDQKLAECQRAQSALLDHHRSAHVGTGDWALESLTPQANSDDHRAHMNGLVAHYPTRKG
jgi:hypothetical protein